MFAAYIDEDADLSVVAAANTKCVYGVALTEVVTKGLSPLAGFVAAIRKQYGPIDPSGVSHLKEIPDRHRAE